MMTLAGVTEVFWNGKHSSMEMKGMILILTAKKIFRAGLCYPHNIARYGGIRWKRSSRITITAQHTFASVSQSLALVSYQRYLGSSHTSVSTMY